MRVTIESPGETRICDTSDDKVAGAWLVAEIRRQIKSGFSQRSLTVSWRDGSGAAAGTPAGPEGGPAWAPAGPEPEAGPS